MPELAPGAARSPQSWEAPSLCSSQRRDSSGTSRFPPHHQEWWEAAPQTGLTLMPAPASPAQRWSWDRATAAQWAQGAPAVAHAMAIWVSASPGQHDMIKSPPWAPSIPSFPLSGFVYNSFKSRNETVLPQWVSGLITCSLGKLGGVCAKDEPTHGRCSSSLPKPVPSFRQWCLYATVMQCQTQVAQL